MTCNGCNNHCKRLYPFRRCIHDMSQATFVCPEFGLVVFAQCMAGCKSCPGDDKKEDPLFTGG